MLSALVRQRTGQLDEALAGYGRALPLLRRDGDDANIARLLVNRGTLLAYQGAFTDALTDLAEAERLSTELELWVLAAMAAHNLGFTEGRRGRSPLPWPRSTGPRRRTRRSGARRDWWPDWPRIAARCCSPPGSPPMPGRRPDTRSTCWERAGMRPS